MYILLDMYNLLPWYNNRLPLPRARMRELDYFNDFRGLFPLNSQFRAISDGTCQISEEIYLRTWVGRRPSEMK